MTVRSPDAAWFQGVPCADGWVAITHSKLDWIVVFANPRGLSRVQFDLPSQTDAELALRQIQRELADQDAAHDQLEAARLLAADCLERLQGMAEGQRTTFDDLPTDDTQLTTFQRRVRAACRQIGWGQTRTYAELATLSGSPRASRAVGNVMARNPLPLVVPCHRVVGSHGHLGGFSSRQGLTMKRRLLQLEAAP